MKAGSDAETSGPSASLLRGLDADQRIAVTTDAAPLAIVAAAGSGKTTVLTRRIARRIGDGSAEARHVLALTFTRDAAGELRRRLRRLDVRDPIETGTFHAVALRLLRDRALTTNSAPPAIAPDRVRLMREVLTETRLRRDPSAALGDIDWARARMVDAADYAEATRSARRRGVLDADEFADVLARYESLKRRRHVVDFDDLLGDLSNHLERDQTFAEVVRWRFRHLFVDEVQDLNPLQYRMLEQIRGGRADICLVGDHRQAIYGWNGADPSALVDVEQQFPGVTVTALTGNYRCSPQIVRAGAAALGCAAIVDDTESRRADGRPIRFVAATDEHDEADRVAFAVRELAHRRGARHVAVLARTNEQLGRLDDALRIVGVATIRSIGKSVLENTVAEACRQKSRELLATWVEQVWADGAHDAIRYRVAEEADRFLSGPDPGNFRAWLEARQPFDDMEPDDNGAVTLLTFHTAKGREWEAVVVTGVENGLVPHGASMSAEQRTEEARLLYVAVTRAGHELIITSAATRNGKQTGPSPWLAPIESTIDNEPLIAVPAELVHRATAPADKLGPLRAWRAGMARVGSVSEQAICSDRVLTSLLDRPPTTVHDLATRLSVTDGAAERWWPRLAPLLSCESN